MREGKKIGKKSWCQIVGMGVWSTLVIIGRSESQGEKSEDSGNLSQSEGILVLDVNQLCLFSFRVVFACNT